MTSPDGAGLPDKEDVGGWAGGSTGPLAILEQFGQYLIMRPLDRLLSGLLGTEPGSFDTVEELVQDLIPAIIRKVLGGLGDLLGGGSSGAGSSVDVDLLDKIPVVGDIAKTIQGITSGLSGALADAAGLIGQRWDQVDRHAESIDTGINGQVVSQGLIDGLQYQLAVFTANGTFTPPTPPSGYDIAYFIVTTYGGGWSGDRASAGGVGVNGQGGRPGGRASRRVTAEEMGSSRQVIVGAGAPARTSDGFGTPGGTSSLVGVLSSSAGSSLVPTPYGDLRSSGEPGRGGDGGALLRDGDSYTSGPGKRGGDTSTAEGGNGGNVNGLWGTGAVSPGNGGNGQIVGDHTSGGGGGGGGGARRGIGTTSQNGAPGGAPGGGGGASGVGGGGVNGTSGSSGPGGRGQVDILTVFKEVAA